MLEDSTKTKRNKLRNNFKKFGVFLLNDDYTTMDFVIIILVKIFNKPIKEAEELTLKIHNQGEALCGVYTHEIAEAKVLQTHTAAKANSFPLKAQIKEIE